VVIVALVRYGACLLALAATAVLGGVAAAAPGPATVVFVLDTAYRQQHVFSADATGGNLTNLTSVRTDLTDIDPPVWSPDGSRLTFAASPVHPLAPRRIFVVTPGSALQEITQPPPQTSDVGPSWSPDNRRLAFTRRQTVTYPPSLHVYVIDADGANEQPVATGSSVDWSVRDRLVYVDGTMMRTSDPDGSNARSIGEGSLPAWSPDGSRLAFYRSGRLWVTDEDGANARQLSSLQMPGGYLLRPPAWSPDGQQLAVTAVAGDWSRVYIVAADGTAERPLTPGFSCCASWSPAGKRLAFQWDGTFVANADGSCKVLIAEGRAQAAAEAWRPGSSDEALACADLAVRGTESARLLRRGRALSYRFEVTNRGDMAATAARLVLHLPGSLVKPRIQASGGACRGSYTVTCDFGTLQAGRSVVVAAATAPRRVASIATVAEVTADQFDPNPADNRVGLLARVHTCSLLGTDRPDKLRGTRRKDVACGLGGADWIRTRGGSDFVAAGAGNDDVVAGPGSDTVYGEAGRDRIEVRDGRRDRVFCGPDKDVVIGDRRDRIARDCEQVDT
jgi:Tol biopolymer transport system component